MSIPVKGTITQLYLSLVDVSQRIEKLTTALGSMRLLVIRVARRKKGQNFSHLKNLFLTAFSLFFLLKIIVVGFIRFFACGDFPGNQLKGPNR